MKKALNEVTILDFSQLLAGPYATQMLGDMGASIIKIERVGSGDLFRQLTFFNKKIGKDTPCFLAWNRNKKSLAIDIKSEEGKKVIYKLAETADVVVQNFRPGVLKKLGYGYDDFSKINPKIIYANNSGYGDDGPYVNFPGQDLLVQGLSGVTTLTGRRSNSPTPLGVSIADQLGAYHLVYGILGALYHREKTGEGQEISVDLLRSIMAFCSQEYMTLLNMDVQYERPDSGIGHPFSDAPFGIYQCKDGYIVIAMGDFGVLSEILEAPQLLEKYATPQDRFDKRDEVFHDIEFITKQNNKLYWMEKLREKDYWAAEVQNIEDVCNDPQVKHMKSITSYTRQDIGEVKCVAPPVTMSKTPMSITLPPPTVGQHSGEILKEQGYTDEEIEMMVKNKIISN